MPLKLPTGQPPILPLLLSLCCGVLLESACLTTLDLDGDYTSTEPDSASLDMKPTTRDSPQDEEMDPADLTPSPDLDSQPDLTPPDPDMRPDMTPPDMPPDMPRVYAPGEGLFFSEVVEGSVGSNKFIEIYNARDTPIELEHIWLATFNMAGGLDVATAVPLHLGAKVPSIPAKQVILLCHSMRDKLVGSSLCDIDTNPPLNFNGDDPLALYFDQDMNGTLEAGDVLLDSFGQLDNTKPAEPIWADASYQRCNLTPYLGGALFKPDMYYKVITPEVYDNLGTPPAEPTSCP